MALVPHGLVEKLFQRQQDQQQLMSDEPVTQISALDSNLHAILKDDSLPSDQKAKLYNQALDRYSTLRNNHLGRKYNETEEMVEKDYDVLSGLPTQYIPRATALYSKIKNMKGVEWNEKGEILFDNETLSGSNIVDLIHTFVKPGRSNAVKPKGWKRFGEALLEHGVPRTMITNKMLWKEIENDDPVVRPPLTRKRINNKPLKPKVSSIPHWNKYGK